MMAPRQDFVVPLFFSPEIGEDQKKKGLRRQSSGFSVQKQVKTKNKTGLCRIITVFLVQIR